MRRGNELCHKGLHAEAIKAFERAAALDADSADAHAGRAAALKALGRHEDAISEYDRAIELYPEHYYNMFYDDMLSPNAALAHIGRGDSLRSLNRHKEAASSYDAAIRIYDRVIEFNAGQKERSSFFAQEMTPVTAYCEYDMGPTPGRAVAHHKRALAHLELGDTFKAIADCKRAIELDPDFSQAHLTRALAHLASKRDKPPKELLPIIDRAIAVDPGRAPLYAARGDALCELACHSYAVAAYDRAIELDPARAKIHHDRGASLVTLGRHEEALEAFSRALKIDPELPGAALDKSRALSALGRHDEALAACDRALVARSDERVSAPDTPQFHVARGVAFDGLGRHDEALSAFGRAFKLGLEDEDTRALLATTLVKLGRPKDALVKLGCFKDVPDEDLLDDDEIDNNEVYEEYRLGRSRWLNTPKAQRARVEALRALGRHDDALERGEAAAFREDDPVAHRACAMALQSLDHHEMALAAYDRAVELDPDYAMTHRDRASVLTLLGRHADALASLDRAAELKPGDAEFHACRAHVLAALGLHPEAAEARRRAESPDPT